MLRLSSDWLFWLVRGLTISLSLFEVPEIRSLSNGIILRLEIICNWFLVCSDLTQ